MDDQAKSIILKTLDIIGYEDDKEDFANKYVDGCYKKTIAGLLETLPKEKQDELTGSITSDSSPEQIKDILLKYFSQEQFTEALEKAVGDSFKEYIDSVTLTLSDSQKTELNSYLVSLSQQTASQ